MAYNSNYPVKFFHETVTSIYGFASRGDGPVLGLEFENELQHPINFPKVPGWKQHAEGSLRDYGYEYVSTTPLKEPDMKRSIKLLFRRVSEACAEVEGLIGSPVRPSNSIRTSVHVHMNAGDLTYIQILNFSIVYWLLEDVLASFCGGDRKGNLFCLRLKDASYQKHCLIQELKDKIPYATSVFSDGCRYASLNLAAVKKFGSLESRLMRGTTNLDEVFLWIDLLLAIYAFAKSGVTPGNKSFLTPKDFQKDFLTSCDAKDYPSRVLGAALYNKLLQSCPVKPSSFNLTNDIRENYIELQDLFNASDTFDFSEDIKKQEKEMKKHAFKKPSFGDASTFMPIWVAGDPVSISAQDDPGPEEQDDGCDSGFDQLETFDEGTLFMVTGEDI